MPICSMADVEEVVADADFYRTGAAYFTGVWEQIRVAVLWKPAAGLVSHIPHEIGVVIPTTTSRNT